jgi:hypothetical protein
MFQAAYQRKCNPTTRVDLTISHPSEVEKKKESKEKEKDVNVMYS